VVGFISGQIRGTKLRGKILTHHFRINQRDRYYLMVLVRRRVSATGKEVGRRSKSTALTPVGDSPLSLQASLGSCCLCAGVSEAWSIVVVFLCGKLMSAGIG
jgi:hypothetical protein